MDGRTLLVAALCGLAFTACDDVVSLADSGLDDGGPGDGGPGDAGPGDGGDSGEDLGCQPPPGLYVPGTATCSTLTPGLERFEPQYPLWTDGARKERLIYLPRGMVIDASEPDAWIFPVGTRVYKTFYVDDVRVETRMLEKVSEGSGLRRWRLRTFAWDETQLAAEEVTDGRRDVLGTEHDIPTIPQCIRCHTNAVPETIMGFSAIQLNHALGGIDLARLNTEGRLRPPIAPDDATIPGDDTQRAALGYLHGNCGHCHGGWSPVAGQDLWIDVGLESVEQTGTWRTAVGIGTTWRVGTFRVAPGDPDGSAIVLRMSTRDMGVDQMPPIGSDLIDPSGLAAVRAWIEEI